jgi:hypothetical protein
MVVGPLPSFGVSPHPPSQRRFPVPCEVPSLTRRQARSVSRSSRGESLSSDQWSSPRVAALEGFRLLRAFVIGRTAGRSLARLSTDPPGDSTRRAGITVLHFVFVEPEPCDIPARLDPALLTDTTGRPTPPQKSPFRSACLVASPPGDTCARSLRQTVHCRFVPFGRAAFATVPPAVGAGSFGSTYNAG